MRKLFKFINPVQLPALIKELKAVPEGNPLKRKEIANKIIVIILLWLGIIAAGFFEAKGYISEDQKNQIINNSIENLDDATN